MSLIMCRRLHLAAASAAAILAALASGGSAAADPAPPYSALLAQVQGEAPRLAEAAAGVRQAEGLARQAAARPNPTVSADVQNFSANGPGADQRQTTFSVEQPLELGGKRTARIAAGEAGLQASKARLTQSRVDYAVDLANAYGDAEAADRQVDLSQETLTLAEEDLRAARALVEAGKEAELRSLQAEAGVTSARAALDAARSVRAAAFARLTALAGSETPFTSVAESLLNHAAPSAGASAIDPMTVPAVLTAQAERDAAARRVQVERTKAIPDVTLSAGVRRFQMDGATAFVAGVSVPFPLFDRNRGNVSASLGELQAAEARLRGARLDAEAALRTAIFQIGAAQTRVAAAQQSEATATEAYRLTRIAYESGKSPLVELTNARRTLAEARAQTIEAEQQRLRAIADLARLQGRTPFGVS